MNSNSVWEFESFLLTSFRGAVVKQPMREYARGQRIAALPLHFHVFRRLFMCAQCTTKTGFNDLFCLMRVSHSAGSNSRIIKKSFFRSMTFACMNFLEFISHIKHKHVLPAYTNLVLNLYHDCYVCD